MTMFTDVVISRGRKPQALEANYVQDLTADDLRSYEKSRTERPQALVTSSPIQRLSERHRNLARLLAAGKPKWEIAAITGYDLSRISVLSNDPSIKELVSLYAESIDDVFVQTNSKLAQIAGTALNHIQDQLEDQEQVAKMTPGQLMELAKMGLDRTGHGPTSKTESDVNVNLATRMASARERLSRRQHLELQAKELPSGTD